MLEQVGAVDMMDISDMCEQEAGSMLLIETADSFCIGFRNESALATKVHNAKMAAEVPECAMATKVLSSKDALNGPRAADHRAAIDKEIYGQMQKFKTYTLIPISDKPGEAKLIDLKLVLAEKFGGSNEFLKAKARLVARGDQMQSGTDYDPFSTTAPSLHYTTLRVLGALAANRGRPLSTSDGTQAYLNATLKEKVFGRLPKELREYTVDGVELIALIVKAIYGLPTSGNAWNQDINAHLTTPRSEGGMGFTRGYADPCFYTRRDGKEWAYIGLAVDNCIHLESSDELHMEVLHALQGKYDWVDEGRVNEVPGVLGAKITQDIAAGTVTFSQQGYIEALAAEYPDLVSPRRVQTPAKEWLEEHVRQALLTKGEPRDPKLIKWFQRIEGSFIFASIFTRGDICWAVNMLSRAMAYPTEELKIDAIRVLNYLVQTKHLCLTFSKSTYFSARTGTPMMRDGTEAEMGGLSGIFSIDPGTSDSDFAAGPSVSGHEFRMSGGYVSCGSTKQSSTQLDTASAELVAGSQAVKVGMFLRNLLDDAGLTQTSPTKLYIDNKATVALAHNPMSFSKTKHVARRHHFMRECVEIGDFTVHSIATEFNVSDIFTKALEPKKFKLFRAALMNLPLESLS